MRGSSKIKGMGNSNSNRNHWKNIMGSRDITSRRISKLIESVRRSTIRSIISMLNDQIKLKNSYTPSHSNLIALLVSISISFILIQKKQKIYNPYFN